MRENDVAIRACRRAMEEFIEFFSEGTEPGWIWDNKVHPIFTRMADEYGISRQTVSRLWKELDPRYVSPPQKPKSRKRSRLEPFKEDIIQALDATDGNIKEAYARLQERFGADIFSSYSTLKTYVARNGLRKAKVPIFTDEQQ